MPQSLFLAHYLLAHENQIKASPPHLQTLTPSLPQPLTTTVVLSEFPAPLRLLPLLLAAAHRCSTGVLVQSLGAATLPCLLVHSLSRPHQAVTVA